MTDPETLKKEPTDWSDPELRRLLNQALAIEFIKVAQKPAPRSKWLDLLNSSTIAAMITVIFGAVFGSLLSGAIQEKSKKNETQLASYKEYLERERQIVEKAFQVIGTLQAACQNLIASTGEDFNISTGSSQQRASVELIKQQIVRDYNTADTQWHAQQLQLGLEIDLEHQNDPTVISAWQDVSTDMTAYSDCAKRWANNSPGLTTLAMQRKACDGASNKLHQDLLTLTKSIENARVRAAATIGLRGQ